MTPELMSSVTYKRGYNIEPNIVQRRRIPQFFSLEGWGLE